MNSDLREKILLRMMRLVKQKSQIQAFYINHDGLVLTELTVLVFIEIQPAVFLKSLFRLSSVGLERHVKQNVDLRRDFSVVRGYLDFFDFNRAVKLESDLLGICAEPFCLPTSVLSPE